MLPEFLQLLAWRLLLLVSGLMLGWFSKEIYHWYDKHKNNQEHQPGDE